MQDSYFNSYALTNKLLVLGILKYFRTSSNDYLENLQTYFWTVVFNLLIQYGRLKVASKIHSSILPFFYRSEC
jgi:hypothetical protein